MPTNMCWFLIYELVDNNRQLKKLDYTEIGGHNAKSPILIAGIHFPFDSHFFVSQPFPYPVYTCNAGQSGFKRGYPAEKHLSSISKYKLNILIPFGWLHRATHQTKLVYRLCFKLSMLMLHIHVHRGEINKRYQNLLRLLWTFRAAFRKIIF